MQRKNDAAAAAAAAAPLKVSFYNSIFSIGNY
jgi:hypothetical protein